MSVRNFDFIAVLQTSLVFGFKEYHTDCGLFLFMSVQRYFKGDLFMASAWILSTQTFISQDFGSTCTHHNSLSDPSLADRFSLFFLLRNVCNSYPNLANPFG